MTAHRSDARRDQAFSYAWDWFSLHASQRMQLVNYFMVATTFLVAAYATLLQNDRYAVALAVSISGLLVCIGFERLDLRTRQLVQIAEIALRELEKDLAVGAALQHITLVEMADRQRTTFNSYKTIFRFISRTLGVLFLVGSGFALFQLWA